VGLLLNARAIHAGEDIRHAHLLGSIMGGGKDGYLEYLEELASEPLGEGVRDAGLSALRAAEAARGHPQPSPPPSV
jgi:hypothetical protein